MPIYFVHDAIKFDLEKLPLTRWVNIQEKTGCLWPDVLTGRLVGDAKVAQVVIAEVAEHVGATVPEPTLASLSETFVFEAKPNLPEQYTDGVPDPKATGSSPTTI